MPFSGCPQCSHQVQYLSEQTGMSAICPACGVDMVFRQGFRQIASTIVGVVVAAVLFAGLVFFGLLGGIVAMASHGGVTVTFAVLARNSGMKVRDIFLIFAIYLVFVVLGCPKQEKWMSEMKGRIPAVMIGVGGALPVLIGDLKRAPLWMQRHSLEWLYRLMQEPKRLFKRYLVTNTIYLYLVISTKLHLMLLGNRFWNEAE